MRMTHLHTMPADAPLHVLHLPDAAAARRVLDRMPGQAHIGLARTAHGLTLYATIDDLAADAALHDTLLAAVQHRDATAYWQPHPDERAGALRAVTIWPWAAIRCGLQARLAALAAQDAPARP